MNRYRLPIILVLCIIGFISPLPVVRAVSTQKSGQEKAEIKKGSNTDKEMDGLSLAAHIAMSAGIASFFLLPELGLLFIPAGFVMGLIALVGGRKRYEHKRGRGLALAAMAVGGAFTLAIFASFTLFLLAF